MYTQVTYRGSGFSQLRAPSLGPVPCLQLTPILRGAFSSSDRQEQMYHYPCASDSVI